MCPLRVILIFLSATLAGFFVLKGLKSQPHDFLSTSSPSQDHDLNKNNNSQQLHLHSKVWLNICSVFWTCIDMASGRYLWRNLVSSSSSSSSSSLSSDKIL
ncbi:hypothetical protein IHE45_09G061200 [Dioscorea alata]|uniref:Uncharacterized protein n=1 Tax=Dioscorea alata TaxID=55571 RepID=A0ACB7VFG3_DIOAL|nr:hypothetical protein IHE45_09G061200 [Dioscorea alata]